MNRFKTTVIGTLVLLLGASLAFAQQQVNLTAGPSTLTLPDGSSVPMWGYSCGVAVTGSTATCSTLKNPTTIPTGGWSAVVITVPSGQTLVINLTNSLAFTPTGATTANNIPTSIVIAGQVGGGLGGAPVKTTSPAHENYSTTWPIANTGPVFVPPGQPDRVQSFATEVAVGTTATALKWTAPRAGTYLLESGTHPSIQVPMGLYGMVVVTTAPAGTTAGCAYPGATAGSCAVNYNADIPLLFSEIDPGQNKAVNTAVNTAGFSESATLGPYSSQPLASINLLNGGSGYTSAPTVTFSGSGGAVATAQIDSDPTSATYQQVIGFTITSGGSYTSAPNVIISGGGGTGATADAALQLSVSTQCRTGTTNAAACYPPAVNYTPLYYMINGQAFDKTTSTNSLFAASPASGVTGNVLVRMVNAGLRMHVPAIVGAQTGASGVSGFSLVAEDGNPLPGVPRVQNEVFMAAGKTYDVMINAPATVGNALPIYDRELSLSGNSTNRDSGMLAYIRINGAALPTSGVFGATGAIARADIYSSLLPGHKLVISDLSKGVIANDTNVTGVAVLTPPLNGQLTLNTNGTFTYVPSANGIALNLTGGGSGYSAPVVVNISAPPSGGTQATATATVGTSGVQSVTVGNGGSGYTAPVVAFSGGGGSGAAATATLSYAIANILGGSGYVASDTLTLAGGGGTGGTATVLTVDGSGGILTVDLTNAGSGYTSIPTVTDTTTPAASGAAVSLATTGTIAAINVTSPGNGYTTPPAISITDGTGTGAAASASLSAGAGVITAVNVTYIGSGYTAAPTVTITGGAGSEASVTATIIPGNSTSDSFVYMANGNPAINATVTLGAASIEAASGITCSVPVPTYTATTAKYLSINAPGVLAFCKDAAGYPLTVDTTTVSPAAGLTISADVNGAFIATTTAAGTYTFQFQPLNSQGTHGGAVTASITFPAPSGLTVTVLDGADKKTPITDYRWVIEEDRTFYVDPTCTTNPLPTGCPTVTSQGAPAAFGTNFHTSHMPVVATGCTGKLSCFSGQTLGGTTSVYCNQGICRAPDPVTGGQPALDPSQVQLDPTKRYYISILPGDAANPFNAGYAGAPDCSPAGVAAGSCGHGMGGAPVVAPCLATRTCGAGSQFGTVTVLSQPSPYPPAKLTVFVFEDDWPLNGEHDAGGGIDVLSPQEPGLGGFQITLQDDAGGTGDATGTPTYDMFNMPLTNSLAGTIDPVTLLDACPISPQVTANTTTGDGTQKGIIGMIVTCPTYESDGVTLSPLAGQAVVDNLYQGRYGVVANPGADRIARGEEWLQTNTLDGQKAHDSFMRIGEPAYFQEFGPGGYHVTIGFANPKIINDRKPGLCPTGTTCTNEVKGHVTTARMSRPPDERLFGSGSRDSFSFTQCYASLGDPDGADFAFVKCDQDGNFDFTGIPTGNFKLTIFDQWNDQIVDGISTPIGLGSTGQILDMGEVAVHQWQANIYTRTFIDSNRNGVSDKDASGNDLEGGLALAATNIRFRDGSFSNFNNTDLNGYAGFNEVFPLFNWYTIETDSTRYKTTGVHVVYDAGGPTDGSSPGGSPCSPSSTVSPCGNSTIGQFFANTYEANPLPGPLSFPGSVYCAEGADCGTSKTSFMNGTPIPSSASNHSTGRIDPPTWFGSYGWQGFSGQNSFLEFGKAPFAPTENGGIHGHVIYASTRPFDDPRLLLQTSWEPLVPGVTVNLYKEDVAADGTQSLTLIDHTTTSSFDDWAQGFRSDGVPLMNCPGQSNTDLYFFGLQNQPNYLDWYNSQHGGPPVTPLPNQSQFKCYDGMHNWNQLQPAPYDGAYAFPSVTSYNPTTGKPAGTNCTACTTNPDSSDPYRFGTPMLPVGKYVVEVVVPPGFELVKEEDKNILIGDNFIAPVTQQFAGLGNVFILPDQAAIGSAFNANGPYNPTQDLGRTTLPSTEADTGSVEQFWPCVGAQRVVPDYMTIFPGSFEVAPFAGATRNLCDRKEITLENQASALAKFYVFTETHTTAHYTGVITDDFTAEFDPFSPQFGEKFAPAYLPVSVKDWTGNEISRVYSDSFGAYNGLSYSTWEVNPPNPTGYGPTMMVTCMNDPGTGATPDPLYQPNYSNFCYELSFMPAQTGYFDTPVVPTSSFSEGYNHPDCNYPDATPAVSSVTSSDIAGPWVSASGLTHTLTINSLPDQLVDNYGYSGPSVTSAPYNIQKVNRHYGFGTAAGRVTIGGVNAAINSWGDTTIVVTVPANIPVCSVQQQAQYQGALPASQRTTRCGQLLITTAAGKQSIDTVTVTVGGKKPTLLAAGQTIQSALDAAAPGDMILVPQGVYHELLIMWKPVRLQGVGATSVTINADAHPAGIMDPWRKQIVCLFGLTVDGRPRDPGSFKDQSCKGSGWTNLPDPNNPNSNFPSIIIDRLPLEAILGWDANLNGNLAEQLIEPSLMGAYEGAAITVLGKGANIPATSTDPFGAAAATVASFPTGTTELTAANCGPAAGPNPYPSNYYCNPSSIDGLTLKNSSQGGGGIFVHGWAHNIQIANNRIHNNQGTLSGGITVGQGEHVDVTLAGTAPITDPGSCETSFIPNQGLPFCYNMNVNVHNNSVTLNSSLGDELFSSTPAGAGGVTFCNGADYYKFNNNWVCGNMSTGDGGGVAHLGFIKNGDIEHNSILFNQSTNPTITTNGGGILVMGAPDADPPCGLTTDQDCLSPPNTISPSDGTGPGLVINANLILGNAADSGSGGGLRLQHVNGTDVLNFPNGATACPTVGNPRSTCLWNSVVVTNNIITNNVAGWDGGGVSLLDALAVNIVNNTITSNDSTASSGVLFGSLFAPLASAPGTNCTTPDGQFSCPQIAGLVSVTNSPVLKANLPTTGITCPPGHGTAGSCGLYSVPLLANDVLWQNRSFVVGVGQFGTGSQNQQKIVTLYNSAFPGPPTVQAVSQTAIGACPTATYWEIGVRGDLAPNNHVVDSGTGTTLSLFPQYSALTDASDYSGAGNLGSNTTFVSQYCNGSRVPPALGSMGYTTNPGTNETNALPTPVFSLTPSATVDEGNNWINLRWGPLALADPAVLGTDKNYGGGAPLGNYALQPSSAAVDYIPATSPTYAIAPPTDFFGNRRPDQIAPHRIDIGAVELQGNGAANVSVTPTSLTFTSVVGVTSAAQTLTLSNNGSANFTGAAVAATAPFSRPAGTAGGTCGATLAAGATCTINIVFAPTAAAPASGTVTITGNVPVTGSPVTLSGTGIARVVSASLAPATWTPTANRGVGAGALCLPVGSTVGPCQTFVLTNTGNVTLTGIAQGALGGTNASDWAIVRLLSTCGPAGGGQVLGQTTLAVGASCAVTVQFRPAATDAAGTSNATVSVTDAAGTQTSTLTGTITVAPLTLTPAGTTSFGTVPVAGTTSATRTFTVAGAAGTPVTWAFSGTNAGDFTRPAGAAGGTCGAAQGSAIPAAGNCTIIVRFKPLATGARTGTLTVPGATPVTLTGTGN